MENIYTLTVSERIILLNLLPPEGNVLTLRIVRKLREALSFSEEEVERLHFREAGEVVPEDDELPAEKQRRVVPDTLNWLSAEDPNKEYRFGGATLEIIRSALNKLNDEKKLREAHIPVWEKFIGSLDEAVL
jgi:hypothetical protein